MKNIVLAVALLVTALVSSAQPVAMRTNSLAWDNMNPWSETVNFTFTAFNQSNVQVGQATAVTNRMPIISLMGANPNGLYYVNGIVLATSGLTSEPSTNFTFRWLGTIEISTQPVSQTVKQGETATFTVATTGGAGTVSYQWDKNGSIITGATGSSLIILNARPADNGNYRVRVSDTTGSAVSQIASLVVTPKPSSPVDIKLIPTPLN